MEQNFILDLSVELPAGSEAIFTNSLTKAVLDFAESWGVKAILHVKRAKLLAEEDLGDEPHPE